MYITAAIDSMAAVMFSCNRTMVLADYAGIGEMATGGAFINKFLKLPIPRDIRLFSIESHVFQAQHLYHVL